VEIVVPVVVIRIPIWITLVVWVWPTEARATPRTMARRQDARRPRRP
jgi:hypothetical protein